MVKLNGLNLGELENEPIIKKKWSVPLSHKLNLHSQEFRGNIHISQREDVNGTSDSLQTLSQYQASPWQ